MLETLTESFCERCGTRYEFDAPEKMTRIKKTRTVISGLKNYIMSQDSLSDSVGDAMRSQAEALAARQLDAFHSSFSFCINCRQYTCANCWNDEAGRCQSCEPLPHTQAVVPQFRPAHRNPLPAGAWPSSDLTEPPSPTWVEPFEPLQLVPEPEPVLAADAEPTVEAEPEPPVVVEADVEPVVEADAEPPVVEAPVVEPTPIRPLRPINETFTRIPRAAPAPPDPATVAADNEMLAARRAQLDMLGIGDPGEGPVGPERNVLPYRSSGASAPVRALASGAFWDASAREVGAAASQVGVRTCAECELSLSATARFCRRCGHPQAQSA